MRFSAAIRAFHAAGDPRGEAVACARLGELFEIVLSNRVAARPWFERAQRLLADEEPCVEQGWVAVAPMGCDVDDPAVLEERAALALDRARRFRDADLEVKALADGGLARVQAGNVTDGMAMIDEAMALACGGAAGDVEVLGEGRVLLLHRVLLHGRLRARACLERPAAPPRPDRRRSGGARDREQPLRQRARDPARPRRPLERGRGGPRPGVRGHRRGHARRGVAPADHARRAADPAGAPRRGGGAAARPRPLRAGAAPHRPPAPRARRPRAGVRGRPPGPAARRRRPRARGDAPRRAPRGGARARRPGRRRRRVGRARPTRRGARPAGPRRGGVAAARPRARRACGPARGRRGPPRRPRRAERDRAAVRAVARRHRPRARARARRRPRRRARRGPRRPRDAHRPRRRAGGRRRRAARPARARRAARRAGVPGRDPRVRRAVVDRRVRHDDRAAARHQGPALPRGAGRAPRGRAPRPRPRRSRRRASRPRTRASPGAGSGTPARSPTRGPGPPTAGGSRSCAPRSTRPWRAPTTTGRHAPNRSSTGSSPSSRGRSGSGDAPAPPPPPPSAPAST
ncbi:MAG: hypothetical protein KatS3mg009_1908 [Acidimicrobiia bacterium]|nr:MAG: hypothetical protein KatS3mg009_1908 [Acidimicrobiia bacterium]